MYAFNMSKAHTSPGPARAANGARAVDDRYLHQIIRTGSSTLDLDRVLAAIVDLVSEAIDCHAAFIYFVETDGSLTLGAVSDPYRASWGGFASIAARVWPAGSRSTTSPCSSRDNALDDPRIKVVPEADEEKYQSFIAVPLRSKAGGVLGVIALHAEAPREFSQEDMDFLTRGASLVAGAVENARLYEGTRRRLALVEDMAALARTIAAAAALQDLLPEVAMRAHHLLDAEACQLFVVESDGASLRRRAVAARRVRIGPAHGPRAGGRGRPAHRRAREHQARGTRLAGPPRHGSHRDPAGVGRGAARIPGAETRPLTGRHTRETRDGGAHCGADGRRSAEGPADRPPDRAKRDQGLPRGPLPRLGRGRRRSVARGRALGCDLRKSHLVLQAAPRGEPGPHWGDVCATLELSATRALPGSVFDVRGVAVRGLVCIDSEGGGPHRRSPARASTQR